MKNLGRGGCGRADQPDDKFFYGPKSQSWCLNDSAREPVKAIAAPDFSDFEASFGQAEPKAKKVEDTPKPAHPKQPIKDISIKMEDVSFPHPSR